MIIWPWDTLLLAALCLLVGYMAGTVHAEWGEHQREMARMDAEIAVDGENRRWDQTWLPAREGWLVTDPDAVDRILREIEASRVRERPTA